MIVCNLRTADGLAAALINLSYFPESKDNDHTLFNGGSYPVKSPLHAIFFYVERIVESVLETHPPLTMGHLIGYPCSQCSLKTSKPNSTHVRQRVKTGKRNSTHLRQRVKTGKRNSTHVKYHLGFADFDPYHVAVVIILNK